MFEKFWQENLAEIRENKLRFAALVACFVVAVGFFLNDDDGEEVVVAETPIEIAERVETPDTKVIPVGAQYENKNLKVVLGANPNDLYVVDPFEVQEVVEMPEIPPVVIVPPVAQVSAPAETFILRGTSIFGNKKSAIVQKISDKNSDDVTLILNVGEKLGGKIIVDIAQDFLILADGTKIFLDTN